MLRYRGTSTVEITEGKRDERDFIGRTYLKLFNTSRPQGSKPTVYTGRGEEIPGRAAAFSLRNRVSSGPLSVLRGVKKVATVISSLLGAGKPSLQLSFVLASEKEREGVNATVAVGVPLKIREGAFETSLKDLLL